MCCWWCMKKEPLVSRVCAGCRRLLLVFFLGGLFFVVGVVGDGVDVVEGDVG